MRLVRILCTALCALVLFASTIRAGGMRVLEDTPRATVLEFSFEGWDLRSVDSLGTLAAPAGVSFDLRSGGPVVPYVHRLIGLPGPEKPRIVVAKVEWGNRFDRTDIRADAPGLDPDLPHLSQINLVTLSEPGIWRGRWVAGLFIVPQRFEGGDIRAVNRMTIRIEYPRTTAPAFPREDRLAKFALANPGAAARWGATPHAAVSAKAARVIASDASLWSSGTVVRIEIETEGMYQITRANLENLGIDLTGVDPRQFRLFGNGGQVLPEFFTASRDTSLRENAIEVTGEDDGSFDENDRILFFGRSVNTWLSSSTSGEYDHTNNPFTRRNIYWLYIPDAGGDPGLRMEALGTDQAATSVTTTARSRLFVENDAIIYSGGSDEVSGKMWYAARLDAGSQYTATVQVQHPVATSTARLTLQIKPLSWANYAVNINGVSLDTLSSTKVTLNVPAGLLTNGGNSISIRQLGGGCYVDWFELDYNRTLTAIDGRLAFDRLPVDGIVRVEATDMEEPWVFDVQQFDRVK
ncbi:MAG: hypothetical protein V2A56_08455, partial [bacterium]